MPTRAGPRSQDDSGNELYRYDFGTKKLTELTVDTNPADKPPARTSSPSSAAPHTFPTSTSSRRANLVPGATTDLSLRPARPRIDYIGRRPPAARWRLARVQDAEREHVVFALDQKPDRVRQRPTHENETAARWSSNTPTGATQVRPLSTQRRPATRHHVDAHYCPGLTTTEPRPSSPPDALAAGILERPPKGLHVRGGRTEDGLHRPTRNGPAHALGPAGNRDDVFDETFGNSPRKGQAGCGLLDARVNADSASAPASDARAKVVGQRRPPDLETRTPGARHLLGLVRIAVSESEAARARPRPAGHRARGGRLSISGKILKAIKNPLARPARDRPAALTWRGQTAPEKDVFKTAAQIVFSSHIGDASRDEISLKFTAPENRGGK